MTGFQITRFSCQFLKKKLEKTGFWNDNDTNKLSTASKELGYIEENNMKYLLNNISEIGRMLNGLKSSLKTKITA